MGLRFFWDSFAVIALNNGNPEYAPYNAEPIVLTEYNLMEVYWAVLRERGERSANIVFDWLRPLVVALDDDTIKEAMQLRLKHKKKRLSYADCLGYVYARRNNLIFLTGDIAFKGMAGVEFVR